MKQSLYYLPLEPYRARYTELLSCPKGWVETAFAPHFDLERIEPKVDENSSAQILTGSVLDSVNRPIWAMQQIAQLLNRARSGQVYLDDFFHPGIEALPYSGRDYRAYAFCWAQSFDRYDFTRPMASWMRPYEAMAMSILRKVFVASPVLADLITTVFPDSEQQVQYVGLPFSSKDVAGRFDPEFRPGPYDVVFSSRFDTEKRPNFFLDVVELCPDLTFAICTGHDELKGNDYSAVARANHLIAKGRITLHPGLSKGEYYSVLKASKVQFNCSLQDWVSFTLLEALTHRCIPVYPAFRDFPVVFSKAPQFLYSPESQSDAVALLHERVAEGVSEEERQQLNQIVAFHDGTLDRIAGFIDGDR